mmetsp:Transcript_29328/g.54414  ORF Transcript_29328/g.54414 Transcript_29328/m.54414 type:complete len:266 (-) Transcript_29328:256-1053(-)
MFSEIIPRREFQHVIPRIRTFLSHLGHCGQRSNDILRKFDSLWISTDAVDLQTQTGSGEHVKGGQFTESIKSSGCGIFFKMPHSTVDCFIDGGQIALRLLHVEKVRIDRHPSLPPLFSLGKERISGMSVDVLSVVFLDGPGSRENSRRILALPLKDLQVTLVEDQGDPSVGRPEPSDARFLAVLFVVIPHEVFGPHPARFLVHVRKKEGHGRQDGQRTLPVSRNIAVGFCGDISCVQCLCRSYRLTGKEFLLVLVGSALVVVKGT